MLPTATFFLRSLICAAPRSDYRTLLGQPQDVGDGQRPERFDSWSACSRVEPQVSAAYNAFAARPRLERGGLARAHRTTTATIASIRTAPTTGPGSCTQSAANRPLLRLRSASSASTSSTRI